MTADQVVITLRQLRCEADMLFETRDLRGLYEVMIHIERILKEHKERSRS